MFKCFFRRKKQKRISNQPAFFLNLTHFIGVSVYCCQRQTAFRSSGIGSTEVDLGSKVNKLFLSFIVAVQPLLWKATVVRIYLISFNSKVLSIGFLLPPRVSFFFRKIDSRSFMSTYSANPILPHNV